MVVIQWDAPSDNNSKILSYNIYLSSKNLKLNQYPPQSLKDTKSLEKTDELKLIGTLES